MRASRCSLLAAAAVAAAASGGLSVGAPAPASAAATWVVKGAGFGHGVGMSAYGAYGLARHGRDHQQILAHYYKGARVGKLERRRDVRVLITAGRPHVTFTGAQSGCGSQLSPGRRYRAARARGGVRLSTVSGTVVARCSERAQIAAARAVSVEGAGSYRGALILKPSGSSAGLQVVNRVDVDDYARGVMPGEVPPNWPAAALNAFAIAVRSVALATDVRGDGFELYPDTRTQVYKGAGAETAQTDRAVADTRGQVLTFDGKVALAAYHSSSGGRTESGFLGAPKVPYLTSVPDPYDRYAPLHRWTRRFSQADIDARLGRHTKGSLRAIRVVKTGDSPRIVTAVLVGTRGRTRIGGDVLASALGLPSRWATFTRRPNH